jgi:REP element-mobilizing transposase RayT
MGKYRKLTHVVYRCDYHIVFVPKYRYRVLEGAVVKSLEKDIRKICAWKEAEIEEMSVQKDHVHLLVSIPPKVSVSEFMGTLEREDGDSNLQELSRAETETVLGESLLGEGLLCQYSRD